MDHQVRAGRGAAPVPATSTATERPSQAGNGRKAPPANRHIERMARSGGLSLVGAGLSAIIGVGLTAVITNGFDQATAGTIFATTSLFLIVTGVVQLGTEVGLVRSLPMFAAQGRHASIRPVLAVALLPVLAVSAATGLAAFLLAKPLADLVAPGADQQVLATQIRVLAVFLPVAAVFNVLLAATRGLRSMVPTVAVEHLGRTAVQFLAVLGAQLAGLGAVAVVLAWSVPYTLGLAAVVVWLALLLRAQPQEVGRARVRGREVRGDFWRFTGPRAVGTASQALLKRSDIVLVAALRSPREAALYAAASRFVVLGQVAVQALQQALSPQLSALFARDNQVAVRDVYRATTAWSMLFAWPIYLSCAVMAPELLLLFGEGYAAVAPVVVVLSIAMLAATACGAVDAVLLMSGHTWLSLGNNVAALVLNLGLNVVLIPAHGAIGAGVAWMASILLRNLLPLAQISFKYRISPVGRETALVAVTAVACFGALPLATRVGSLPVGWTIAALGAGSVLYLAAVWLLRGDLHLRAFLSAVRGRRNRQAESVPG